MLIFLLSILLSRFLQIFSKKSDLHFFALIYFQSFTWLNKFFYSYKLVHDGSLTWRFSRGKMVELHAVLLEGVLLLLTKAGDGQKLLLKIQVSLIEEIIYLSLAEKLSFI